MRGRFYILGGLGFAALYAYFFAVPAGAMAAIVSTSGEAESNKDAAIRLVGEFDAANQNNFFQNNGIIDRRDILAMFQVESRFNPSALNLNDGGQGNHAYGIGQMLETTARDIGVTNPNDLLNIDFGVSATLIYMRFIFDFLVSNLGRNPTRTEWIGAYNIGIGNVINGNVATLYLAKVNKAKPFI